MMRNRQNVYKIKSSASYCLFAFISIHTHMCVHVHAYIHTYMLMYISFQLNLLIIVISPFFCSVEGLVDRIVTAFCVVETQQ